MDQGIPRPTAREGRRRPAHPPRAHHRHRQRELAGPSRPRTPGQERSLTPTAIGHAPIAAARRATRAGPRRPARLAFYLPIREHQHQQATDATWGHFKPSRRGQCKPSLSDRSHSGAWSDGRRGTRAGPVGADHPPVPAIANRETHRQHAPRHRRDRPARMAWFSTGPDTSGSSRGCRKIIGLRDHAGDRVNPAQLPHLSR